MANAQSPEQRELSLVGKVEMRIALADTDAKLTSTLNTYLAPLLLKLASEHQSVRNKVISVCQHVNTRVKPQSIQLPVAALIKQFTEQESSLIRHFDLLYIQQGISRISNNEKAALLPVVVKGISQSGKYGPQIFNLLLRILEFFTLPLRGSKEDAELRNRLDVSEDDTQYLAAWIGKLMLFNVQKSANARSPGLTQDDYVFLTLQNKDDVWTPASGGLNLLRTKILAAKLLASGLFVDSERFLPALFASADPASNISDVGDDMMKRALPATDLEDAELIKRLYALYFGSDEAPRVRAPLRLKILNFLNKSTVSTTFADEIMKVVDDGIASPVQDGDDVVMSNGGAPSIGREATKLRAAIFTYINFVAKYGSKDTLHAIAPHVVNRLRDFVENQGWPQVGPNEDLVSRGYAYEVIGLLAKAGPRNTIVEEEHATLDLLGWLFMSLAKDTSGSSIIVSVEESLSIVMSAMGRLDLTPAEQSVLEDLLIDQMEQSAHLEANKRLRSTRFVTIRFANRCLPYSSVKARWVNVLGVGASKDRAEVREEAQRGLNPYWHRMINGATTNAVAKEMEFPTFEAVMAQFFSGHSLQTNAGSAKVVQRAQQSFADCFLEMTSFSRRMLFQEAMQKSDVAVEIDSEWERRLDVALEKDVKVREAIKEYMRTFTQQHALYVLQAAIYETVVGDTKSAENDLVEFLSLAPDPLLRELVPHTYQLLPVLKASNHSMRLVAAQVFGILASHETAVAGNTDTQVNQLVEICKSWETATGSASYALHGAITALGFYFSRAACRGANVANSVEYETSVRTALDVLLKSRDGLLLEASYIFIGQLCMFGAVTLPSIEKFGVFKITVDKIYEAAKTGNEQSTLCLGQLAMIVPEEPEVSDSKLQYIEDQLHKLHEIRQAEAHFTVGEALSYLASGWESDALQTKLDIDSPKPKCATRTATLGKLTDRMLKDSANTKPSLKKAAVMWLLCLVQFCGQQAEIQSRLPQFQAAFKRCLGDRDELVQETASRGLGIIYEKGDRHLKDELVRDLVSSFSSDRQSQLAGNVSADTQLFEPGALPTGDGSVSTYKDIMSLAAEVGDSSLVYRFMSMASSNAIWSSRAAFGRFGLSNVLSDSSVDGYLASNPKIYPKLFRYRFDPNSGVQRSMNDIWNALVKDPSATVDKHFDAIMDDLLSSILGKEWRVRQASCAAIADLVSSHTLNKYEKYLEQIWTQCFKVLDDIKESVRAAATSLARTLTGVLTRTLEADHTSTKNAAAMLRHVLPFLLSPSGMESSAKEVQLFSIHTLLEIIKKSNGSTLRPFIPELVERLIGLLSSVEPEAVNYVHLNASKYNLTEQKIDDMRLMSVRNSPIMEAMERCLDLLDESSMRDLQPRLDTAMKNAVGLPSKVGSSRILVSLATRRMPLFRDFSDHYLKLIEKLVLDRNETIASSYAAAAGYVARGASDKQILQLLSFSKKLYFESENDREGAVPRRSISAGEIVYAVAKHASDRFNGIASSALPFVFVAKHDSNEQVKEQFEKTWDESVGGSRAVLLYLSEIVELCITYLDSPQWVLKHTSARAVADAASLVSAMDMSERTAETLWPAVEKALGGKTWEGKEVVLAAFADFVEHGAAFCAKRLDVKAFIVKIAIREAKRQNNAYRQYSVKALGRVALALTDSDLSAAVYDIVEPLLSGAKDDDEMDVDGEAARTQDDMRENTQTAAVETLLASINPSVSAAAELNNKLPTAFALIAHLPCPRATRVRKAVYESLSKLFGRMGQRPSGQAIDFDAGGLQGLLFGGEEIEALRVARADAIHAIFAATPELAATQLAAQTRELRRAETSRSVRDRLPAI